MKRISADSDDNPRPLKRSRHSDENKFSPQTGASPPAGIPILPPAILLVSLPALLIHPPTHRYYVQSIFLSLQAVRKCLALKSINPDVECRAWTAIAELAMRVIGGGFSQSDEHVWAKDIEIEAEKAIGKGLLIAQKHPSLRAYGPHLTLLRARLSEWQHNFKFSRTLLRRLASSLLPTDPPHIIYNVHLAIISNLTSSASSNLSLTDSPRRSMQDIHAALGAVHELQVLSVKNTHTHVTLLSHVLRLRILVSSNMWNEVGPTLRAVENALGLSYDHSPASTAKPPKSPRSSLSSEPSVSLKSEPQVPTAQTFISFDDAFESFMAIHALIMGVVFHTYAGNARDATVRLTHLHTLLDSGAAKKVPHGIVQIAFPSSPPLFLQMTHPRVLFLLVFLVSSAAKRDPVGRKPKRKVFATEGIAAWENEMKLETPLPPWAGMADLLEVEQRMASIKADLLCELVGVSIMRSEFDAAEKNINVLVAHARTYGIFPSFAARITLHHAHLAHARGQAARAAECYRVAAHLAEEGSFVRVAARAGAVALGIGAGAQGGEGGARGEETVREAREVAESCRGMGSTLEAVGRIIEACLSGEIIKAKEHLKDALRLATKAQDNHLRALLFALISAHYFHTASGHAETMLGMCEQLAAGLGAAGKGKDKADAVGNAPLRLWVGERFLELHKRRGNEAAAQQQAVANERLSEAVRSLRVSDGRI